MAPVSLSSVSDWPTTRYHWSCASHWSSCHTLVVWVSLPNHATMPVNFCIDRGFCSFPLSWARSVSCRVRAAYTSCQVRDTGWAVKSWASRQVRDGDGDAAWRIVGQDTLSYPNNRDVFFLWRPRDGACSGMIDRVQGLVWFASRHDGKRRNSADKERNKNDN
jgi:hypothetical protein